MNLFRLGSFRAHSGQTLPFKIDCDALTDEDWRCLAYMAKEMIGDISFSEINGIPRGGQRFAEELRKSYNLIQATLPEMQCRLIVDDVYTTGVSILECMTREDDVGIVVFARKKPEDPRIKALFIYGT